MRYLQLSVAVVASAFTMGYFAPGATAEAQAPAQAPKPSIIGLVDKDKVVLAYPKAEQLAKELKREEDRVHKMIEEGNKQLEEAKTQKKPPAELEGLQKRLQTTIDTEVKKVQAKASSLESQLENEVSKAIRDEAAARKVDIVLWKPVVFMGGVDLTDGVMKRLAAVATAGSGNNTKAVK